MTIKEIEIVLSAKNKEIDDNIGKTIERFCHNAINKHNEEQANYYWCLFHIFLTQKNFLEAINALRCQNYEDAWLIFDNIDIDLINLENNFDMYQGHDRYHLNFIGRIIKEYQKLFPYHYFFSRESIIKEEKCSICGLIISLRHSCGHKVGKLYMGKLCTREITKMDLKAIALVTDPFDKYAYVKIQGEEYNYCMLEKLMTLINDPYDDFRVEITKVKKKKYEKINRNSQCPCGSGKKYKKCHLDTDDELMDHYNICIKH